MRAADLLCHMRKEKGHGSISVAMTEKAGGAAIPAAGTGKPGT